MNDIIILHWLTQLTGLDQASVVFLLGLLYWFANYLARAIPDNATGWRGFVRSAASAIALYKSSQIAPGVSIKDAAKASLSLKTVRDGVAAKATHPSEAVELEDAMRSVTQQTRTSPFRRSDELPFDENGFASLGALLAIALLSVLLLSGCTPGLTRVCEHADTIERAAEATLAAVRQCPGKGIY